MIAPAEELEETKKLVLAVLGFSANYLFTSRKTGDEPLAQRAHERLEEALIECMRQAFHELHPGNLGERIRTIEAWIASLEAPVAAPNERIEPMRVVDPIRAFLEDARC